MNPEVLDIVLACKKLPSMPAVAAQVIELTGNQDVSIHELASTIKNDQGLSAKILRTVNSSFYGLRQRCGSIDQAIVMLGLSAVKSLALGFSLVDAVSSCDDGEGDFDYQEYWTRSLYTGVAGRCIATEAGCGGEEEAFLGGLLQDVGMVALYQALGDDYSFIFKRVHGDHRALAKAEIECFGVQHPDIGALLAGRWKLPEELSLPIKYHERPTAAPREHLHIVQAVGLGNFAADALMSDEPAEHLKKFYKRAADWFALTTAQCDDILDSLNKSAKEMASLLQIQTGETQDAEAILKQAREQLASMPIPEDAEPGHSSVLGNDAPKDSVDQLTGFGNRRRYEQLLIALMEQTAAGAGPMAVGLFDIDGCAQINERYGEEAGDAVVLRVAMALDDHFVTVGGSVCRYGEDQFAVLLPRTERLTAVRAMEQVRKRISQTPVALICGRDAPPELNVSVSVGVTTLLPEDCAQYNTCTDVSELTEQALAAAKRAGRNTLRANASERKAA